MKGKVAVIFANCQKGIPSQYAPIKIEHPQKPVKVGIENTAAENFVN